MSTNLEVLLKLMEERKGIVENLERLSKMRDRVIRKDKPNVHECQRIVFESPYSASVSVHDDDLKDIVLAATVTYYTNRVKSIDMLVGLSERALSKEVGTDILVLLEKHLRDSADMGEN